MPARHRQNSPEIYWLCELCFCVCLWSNLVSWDSENRCLCASRSSLAFLPFAFIFSFPGSLKLVWVTNTGERVAYDEVETGEPSTSPACATPYAQTFNDPRCSFWGGGGVQGKRLEPKNIQYFWMSSALKKQSPLNAPKGVCVSPSGADVNAWCEGKVW